MGSVLCCDGVEYKARQRFFGYAIFSIRFSAAWSVPRNSSQSTWNTGNSKDVGISDENLEKKGVGCIEMASLLCQTVFLPEKHLQNHRAELDPRSSKGSHILFHGFHTFVLSSAECPLLGVFRGKCGFNQTKWENDGVPCDFVDLQKGQLGVFFSMHILDCETIIISMFCICSMNFMRFPYTLW